MIDQGGMTKRWRRDRQGRVVLSRPRPVQMTYTFPLHRETGVVWARAVVPVDILLRVRISYGWRD